ncbi:MAG: Protein translocase subunit SecA, partial [Parcubacteria group bacterium GW2011_GWC2_38_7]
FNKEDSEKIKALGGLFVLGTERHESRRIDNQLRGRAGRQGDPGASQFYVSMEDELMRIFGSDRVKNLMQRMGLPEDQAIENKMIANSIEKAQKKVEGNNFDVRKHLVEYDDIINKQREIIYRRRREILESVKENPEHVKKQILEMIEEEIEQVVFFHTSSHDQSVWDMKEISEVVKTIFPFNETDVATLSSIEELAGDRHEDAAARTKIVEFLMETAKARYEDLEKEVESQSGSDGYMRVVEREIVLRTTDNMWVDHLDAIALLRTGIGLRGYAQRDPLLEYKRETYEMFMQLQNVIKHQIVYTIYKIGYAHRQAKSLLDDNKIMVNDVASVNQFNDPYKQVKITNNSADIVKKQRDVSGAKVGRNDLCPCGSGKKYKKCCGE